VLVACDDILCIGKNPTILYLVDEKNDDSKLYIIVRAKKNPYISRKEIQHHEYILHSSET
jgi:hypothetical protein